MIHKEATMSILIAVLASMVIISVVNWLSPNYSWIGYVLAGLLMIIILQFFRNPKRTIEEYNDNLVYAPADGKVVIIEETEETEYFKEKRLQVSIFMSPLNVHVNRNPFSGTIEYFKYHKGKYLVAWHPKSSQENERTTVVFSNGKKEVLLRQIAGALARRIVCYVDKGDEVKQGDDFGFIKFGSRVDIFLPLDAKIKVSLDQMVKGNKNIIADNIMSKPLILVTNDDGIESKGIKSLIEVAQKFGEVVVVAPDSPQSGQGHAITLTSPIRITKRNIFDNIIEAYECSGTPVDSVKLAKNILLKGRTIDLCVSGINHGSNASLSIIYSGTMSAAMEASIEGINAIGFSLLDHSRDADFSTSKIFAEKLISSMLAYKGEGGQLWNVNIPKLKTEEVKGIKFCKQGIGKWKEDFKISEDPRGDTYYWLAGSFEDKDNATDTDLWALENGYISVVPSHHDLTDYAAIKTFSYLNTL